MSVRQRKNNGEVVQGLRVMSEHEAMQVEEAWNRSDEKRRVDERRRQLAEDIGLKTGAYSPRA